MRRDRILISIAAVGIIAAAFIWITATQKDAKPNSVQSSIVKVSPKADSTPTLDLQFAVKACQAPILKKYNHALSEKNTETDFDRTGISGDKFVWYTNSFKCEVSQSGVAVLSGYADEEIKVRLNKDCTATARRVGYDDPTYKFAKMKIDKNKNGLILTGLYGGQSFQCTSYDPSAFQAEFADGGVEYFIGREGDRQNKEQAANADLFIKSWHCNIDGDYMKFVGEVTNQTAAAMANVEAVGEVYDKNGLVDRSEALIDYHNLRPGETSPFSTLVDTGGRGDSCNISFKTFDGTPINSARAPK